MDHLDFDIVQYANRNLLLGMSADRFRITTIGPSSLATIAGMPST